MTDIDRDELIAGLRELADFLEEHPEAPLPYPHLRVGAYGKEEFYEAVRAFAPMHEVEGMGASYIALQRNFGPLKVITEASRKTVCEPVVRTETVTAYELPADLRTELIREQMA